MLKDVNVVVLSVQVVRYLGFLQDSYPWPQRNAQLLQPFLGKVGKLEHPDLRLLEDPGVFLVAEVLEVESQQGRLVAKEFGQLFNPVFCLLRHPWMVTVPLLKELLRLKNSSSWK